MAFIIPAGTGLTMGTLSDGAILRKSSGTVVGETFSGETWIKLGADRTSTSTTLADITDLSFAVAASKAYAFWCFLVYQTAATTTGININCDGPASPTGILFARYVSTLLAGAGTKRMLRAYQAGTATASVETQDVNFPAIGEGLLRNGSNAGTFALQFASEVGSSQVTIKAGSILVYKLLD